MNYAKANSVWRTRPFLSSCTVLKFLGDVAVPRSKHEFVQFLGPKAQQRIAVGSRNSHWDISNYGCQVEPFVCLGFVHYLIRPSCCNPAIMRLVVFGHFRQGDVTSFLDLHWPYQIGEWGELWSNLECLDMSRCWTFLRCRWDASGTFGPCLSLSALPSRNLLREREHKPHSPWWVGSTCLKKLWLSISLAIICSPRHVI